MVVFQLPGVRAGGEEEDILGGGRRVQLREVKVFKNFSMVENS